MMFMKYSPKCVTLHTVQSIYSARFGAYRNGSCYKGTILHRNYRKMTILWSFSYNSIVKFHGQKIGSLMTVLYPNMCYNEVCCKGTALF